LCGLNCHIGEIGSDGVKVETTRTPASAKLRQGRKYRKLIFDKRNYNWIWEKLLLNWRFRTIPRAGSINEEAKVEQGND